MAGSYSRVHEGEFESRTTPLQEGEDDEEATVVMADLCRLKESLLDAMERMFDKYLPVVRGSSPQQHHDGCVVHVGQHHGGGFGHGVCPPMHFDDQRIQFDIEYDTHFDWQSMGDPIYDVYPEDTLILDFGMEQNEQRQVSSVVDSFDAAPSSLEGLIIAENYDDCRTRADQVNVQQNPSVNESHIAILSDCKENVDFLTESFTFKLDEKAEKAALKNEHHLPIQPLFHDDSKGKNSEVQHIALKKSSRNKGIVNHAILDDKFKHLALLEEHKQAITTTNWNIWLTLLNRSESRSTPFQEGEDDVNITAKQVHPRLQDLESRTTPFQEGEDDEDIPTNITRHGSVAPSHEPTTNLVEIAISKGEAWDWWNMAPKA
ncbi:hypothetical protein EJB05_26202, partial [Eragrostis curvula]